MYIIFENTRRSRTTIISNAHCLTRLSGKKEKKIEISRCPPHTRRASRRAAHHPSSKSPVSRDLLLFYTIILLLLLLIVFYYITRDKLKNVRSGHCRPSDGVSRDRVSVAEMDARAVNIICI